MTPQELDKMVSAMRDHKANIKTRVDLGDYPYHLMYGLKAIGRNVLASELEKLYEEIEKVDTSELCKIETFR